MSDPLETRSWFNCNTLGRRIRGDQIWMFSFKRLQFAEQFVPFVIADCGRVEHVVGVIVLLDFTL